jgi:hypothetical protein
VHSLVDYPLREPALAALLFAMMGALAARSRTELQQDPAIPHRFE